MKKRFFTLFVSLALAAGTLQQEAQAAPVAGKDYVVLQNAQPVGVPAGKIEVIEFMWYGCPHCNDFDPSLEAWKAKQAPDVVFKRVPVAFRDDFIPHSKMELALDAMGVVDKVTPAIFHEINVNKNYLLTPAAQANFLATQGVDKQKYLDTYNSFAVSVGLNRATQMLAAYKVDGTPTLAVQGQYETSPAIVGSEAGAIQTLDYLVQMVRTKSGGAAPKI